MRLVPYFFVLICSSNFKTLAQSVIADFVIPDTVCVNTPVIISNNSLNASSYYWNFCLAAIDQPPEGKNLGNIDGALRLPVFTDHVFYKGSYYVFVSNNYSGGLVRLDFGNSMLNKPTVVNLGNMGGVIPNNLEGLQIVQNGGKWYTLMVGGYPDGGVPSRIIKIEFGADLLNTNPVATNWGNIGNLDYPHDFHVFNENGNWYGFTVNSINSTFTRFNFGTSFNNPPTAVNIGNKGSLENPTGIYVIKDGNNWHVFLTNNSDSSSITRLDFGSSLLNTPSAVNLGNVNNTLYRPRDINLIRYCDKTVGFVVNGLSSDLVRLDFNNGLTGMPTARSLGNIGDLSFPHTISRIFRSGNDLYSFVTNVNTNSITRLRFSGCVNANIPNSNLKNPPAIVYDVPGTYNINLTIDEGLPTQAFLCKQVVVLPYLEVNYSYTQDACNPLKISFLVPDSINSIKWDFGDGSTVFGNNNVEHVFTNDGTYSVSYYYKNYCSSSVTKKISVGFINSDIIKNNDSVICENGTIQMQADSAMSYCWEPVTYLNNPEIANPVAKPLSNISYSLVSKTRGSNLVINGDFAKENSGFTSRYNYSTSGVPEGVYFVGASPFPWHPNMPPCKDHTSSEGNMLLVNGATQPGIEVWKQKVSVSKNTNYEFACWAQNITIESPSKLHFAINGKPIGIIFKVNDNFCVWERFLSNWNSDTNTSAEISILNMNTEPSGNDFALDDISFAPVIYKKDNVSIIIDKPSVKASNDTSICENTTLQLIAKGATTYSWLPATGLDNNTIANPVATIKDSVFKYIVSGVNTYGCVAKDTVLITVLSKPSIGIINDTSVCANTNLDLHASGGMNYQWSPSGTLSNPGIPNPVASPAFTTRYSVKVTNSNNCSESKNVTITVLPIPQIRVSNDTTLCRASSVSLYATGGNSYVWSPSEGLNNNAIATPVAMPDVSNVYKVIITDSNNCVNSDSVIITVRPDPVFGIKGNNLGGCAGSPFQLTAFGGDRYEWSPRTGLSDPNIANPIVQVYNDQTYSVVISEAVCRKSEIFSVPIRIDTVSNVIVSKSNDINCNTPIAQLSTNISGISYLWTPAGSLSDATVASPVAFPAVNTIYTVSIKAINGCKVTGSVEVKAINNIDFRLYQMPNSFTPNGDGKNDCFGIAKWGSINIIKFLVFNRWGQVVFAGNNSNPCWDGNFKGIAQQSGNFVYKLTAQSNCGVIERKGNVVLIR